MVTQFPFLRRIVTGMDAAGRSCVRFDDSGHDRGGNVDLWMQGAVAANDGDPAALPLDLLPAKGCVSLRYVVIQPESVEAAMTASERRAAARAFFSSMGAPDALVDTIDHPHAHRTPTADYIVMLWGELTLLLENEERTLVPGNVVVQRGTSHAWVNRGSVPAVMVAVMIDDRQA